MSEGDEVRTVGSEFPSELRRVTELRQQYLSLGPNGTFGAIMLAAVIKRAEEAWRSGDVVAIVRSFQEMKGCE